MAIVSARARSPRRIDTGAPDGTGAPEAGAPAGPGPAVSGFDSRVTTADLIESHRRLSPDGTLVDSNNPCPTSPKNSQEIECCVQSCFASPFASPFPLRRRMDRTPNVFGSSRTTCGTGLRRKRNRDMPIGNVGCKRKRRTSLLFRS